MGEKNESKTNASIWMIVIIVLGGVFFLWWLIGMVVPNSSSVHEAGEFGDQFGGVNALFSGLAFFLLSVTLFLQLQEQRMMREQIEKMDKNSKESLSLEVLMLKYRHSEDLIALKKALIKEYNGKKSAAHTGSSNPKYDRYCGMIKDQERHIEILRNDQWLILSALFDLAELDKGVDFPFLSNTTSKPNTPSNEKPSGWSPFKQA